MASHSPMLLLLLLLALALRSSVAINYPGGWAPSLPAKQHCVDICASGSGRPTCPTQDPACERKAQRPGDFDFLLLEQLFLPQFCRELLIGVDPTLEHRPVRQFPAGIACRAELAERRLSIHGLWPNYAAGFPTCCNISDSERNRPFDPRAFARKHAELLEEMSTRWIDPTQPADGFDSLCELYNHEFQKHGLCYAADTGGSYEESARIFFRATMDAADSPPRLSTSGPRPAAAATLRTCSNSSRSGRRFSARQTPRSITSSVRSEPASNEPGKTEKSL